MMDDPLGPSRPFQYSIPAESDGTPLSAHPLQYATAPDTFDFIREGIGRGAQASLVLAILYAMGVALFFAFTAGGRIPTEEMRNFLAVGVAVAQFYGSAVMAFGVVIVFGGVPALLLGFIGGGLIGVTFRFIKKQMPPRRAYLYGGFISAVLVVAQIGIIAWARGLDQFSDDLTDQMMWLIWFAPNLISFFGFWWVAVKINEKLPVRQR